MATAAELVEEARLLRALPPPEQRRLIRTAAGHSQAKMAAALGVSAVTVLRWERGSRVPRGPHLRRYVLLLAQLTREVFDD
jgi:DNA-binding transcriptional regulator YiaG